MDDEFAREIPHNDMSTAVSREEPVLQIYFLKGMQTTGVVLKDTNGCESYHDTSEREVIIGSLVHANDSPDPGSSHVG